MSQPTKEEQDVILKLAMAIYANLMGTLDAEEKVHDYTEGNETGTEIYRAAARESFHRAEWFIAELREWKQRVTK
jgi:hypothetical protein